MRAVLTENGFIDNSHDAHLLKDDGYLYEVAKAHAKGIAKIFSLKLKGNKGSSTNSKKYEVIGGTFSSKENALRQEAKARKAGIESYVKKRGGYYEVIVGTFSNYEGAKIRSRYLERTGIETYIK